MTKKIKEFSLFTFVFSLCVFAVYFSLGTERLIPQAHAGATQNVSGWAWSDMPDSSDEVKVGGGQTGRGAGWISFNNISDGASKDYGVNIDASGNFSGYAWSENVGWVSFNAADVSGCPSGTCAPHVNFSTGAVTGWARATAGVGSGWDGWISLSSANDGGPSYGITMNTSTGVFSGKAWGSTIMGWIDFSVSGTVRVIYNPLPPTVTLSAFPTSITSGQSSTLTWTVSNATSCTKTNGWTGSLTPANGNQSTGALTTTTTYTLTCFNPIGVSASASATVTVTAVPNPSVTLSASPTSVTSGGASTLTWTVANATSCTKSNGWTGSLTPANGNQSTGALTTTTTYTLTCVNSAGTSASASATVTVTAAALPSVTLSASPTSVTSGSASTLTWTVSNATSCTKSNGWSGALSPVANGNQSTGALSADTTYTLTCTNASGSTSASATVTVTAAALPSVTLSASPTSVTSGQSSTLTWTVSNATSCTKSNGWSGALSPVANGNQSTGALSADTTYTLTCTNASGSSSASATVTVTAAAPSVTANLSANPTTGNTPPDFNTTLRTSVGGTATGPIDYYFSCTWADSWHLSSIDTYNCAYTYAGNYTVYTYVHRQGIDSNVSTVPITVTGTQPPAPSVTLSASPALIVRGDYSYLTWTVANAATCTKSNGWTGQLWPLSNGSGPTPTLLTTTTYTLTCFNPAGVSASASATVTVATTPTVPGTPVPYARSCEAVPKVGLRWTASTATGYRIYRSTTSGGPYTDITYPSRGYYYTGSPVDYTDGLNPLNPLIAGGTYYYKVAAQGPLGDMSAQSAASGPATASSPCGAFDFSLSNGGAKSVTQGSNVTQTITATLSSGTTQSVSYTVSGLPSGVTTSTITSCSPTCTTNLTLTASASATVGTFTITVTGTGGVTHTTSFSLTVTAPLVPPVPGTPVPYARSCEATPKVGITWTASTGAIGYRIYRSTTSGGPYADITYPSTGYTAGTDYTDGVNPTDPLTAGGTYYYMVAAYNGNGFSAQSAASGPATASSPCSPTLPTVTLSASPTSVTSGSASNLTWTVSNATSCFKSGGWTGSLAPANGNQSTGALNTTTTYTLTCSNASGPVNASATVTVSGGGPGTPTVTLSASPTSVTSGGASTLTWTVANATSCTKSNGWTGSLTPANGNQSTGALSADTTYTLTCTNASGSSSASATVTIGAGGPGLDVSCNIQTPTVPPYFINNPITFQATVTGGTPPYTYTWSKQSIPVPPPSSNSFTTIFQTIGDKLVNVSVTDSTAPTPLTGQCSNGGVTLRLEVDPNAGEF